MNGYSHCQVVTTIDSKDAADDLARAAVQARAAACAQVIGPISSSYWWEGSVQTEQEWQVVFKTTQRAYGSLEEYIRAHHSYDVPEILCLPVTAGHRPYLEWLDHEVA
ncbi:divalent-cation tolerance protein CutA [Natronosporangium hydrolyticum]|uniref:Divalent-cation tolerance protein CutA n=1 Tax=Natronosporangium hydrolyticum TaxID=2811111 RepID=A0A895YJV5_9ACTN|nr:divalent-cation tolerance protein CutA [Natronosporangium hydrolyticum]QSB15623.1 divalent-cation tolerance protein CutA [Natronosporangium hydrolyticum]